MKRGLFITGTDTGVGKTWVTIHFLKLLRESGIDGVGMKPIECGGREDAIAIQKASGGALSLDEVNPLHFADPVAPAALTRPLQIDFAQIRTAYENLAARHEFVLVEGAGGWLVPLDTERTMADLAIALGLPVLVVAANRLGVLNHTLLTVRAIQSSGLVCSAVFLNEIDKPGDLPDVSRESNARVLRDLLPGIDVIEREPAALSTLL